MAQKIPPPPQFTGPEWQLFNRWLLEVTSVLSNTGGIDPAEVTGLSALFTQVAANTTDITTLEGELSGQGGDISALQAAVAGLAASIATINGQITTLASRNQVFNGIVAPLAGQGVNGDWYGDTVAKHIYIKVAGAWVLII